MDDVPGTSQVPGSMQSMREPMTLSPQEFVAKWRHASLKESAAYQEHFTDLCRLIGHPTPAEADPAGKWFTFQAGAGKVAGGQGFADVWKMGYFGWEYKGPGADLGRPTSSSSSTARRCSTRRC